MENFLNALKTFGLFMLYTFHEAALYLFFRMAGINNKIVLSILMLIGTMLVTYLFIHLYRKDIKKDYNDFKEKENILVPKALKYWGYGLLAMVIANTIISTIVNGVSPNEEANRTLIEELYIFAIPSVIIFGPICEEIIFRLSFKKITGNRKYLFILTSGIIFGLVHVISLNLSEYIYMIPYVGLGIAFSALYYNYDNIWCSIFVHIIHNLLCVILILMAL